MDKPKVARYRKFFFTAHLPEEQQESPDWPALWDKLQAFLRGLGADHGRMNGEKGNETGSLHWQGAVSFPTQRVMSKFAQDLGAHVGKHPWVRPLGDEQMNYVIKEETRVAGPFGFGELPSTEILWTGLEGEELFPFQKEVLALCDKPMENTAEGRHELWRAIHWYWSAEGDRGKTSLFRMLYDRGTTIFLSGTDFGNAASALADWVAPEKGAPKPLKVAIINFARHQVSKCNYDILEGVKDGLMNNTKYRCRTARFNPPHLIVFANEPPATSLLSADRWHVTEIE